LVIKIKTGGTVRIFGLVTDSVVIVLISKMRVYYLSNEII
jgi:hypothetical protein